MHQGTCLCGNVKFEILGDFNGFYLCHCSRCRKETGSAHASNLFSMTATLNWISGRDHVRTFHLANTRFEKSFCDTCGCALPTLQESGRLLVPAGSLDTEMAIRPNAHIFMGSRALWDNELESLIRFENLPAKSVPVEAAHAPGLTLNALSAAIEELDRKAQQAQPLPDTFWDALAEAWRSLGDGFRCRRTAARKQEAKVGYIAALLTIDASWPQALQDRARCPWDLGLVGDDGQKVYNDAMICLQDRDSIQPGETLPVHLHVLTKDFWADVAPGKVITIFNLTQPIGHALITGNKLI